MTVGVFVSLHVIKTGKFWTPKSAISILVGTYINTAIRITLWFPRGINIIELTLLKLF
jgi:hypothetical protein